MRTWRQSWLRYWYLRLVLWAHDTREMRRARREFRQEARPHPHPLEFPTVAKGTADLAKKMDAFSSTMDLSTLAELRAAVEKLGPTPPPVFPAKTVPAKTVSTWFTSTAEVPSAEPMVNEDEIVNRVAERVAREMLDATKRQKQTPDQSRGFRLAQ